jgi:hypothetical protein
MSAVDAVNAWILGLWRRSSEAVAKLSCNSAEVATGHWPVASKCD